MGCGHVADRFALTFGFTRLGLDEIVSFTARANQASRRVMEKLGMRHAGDFEHPLLPAGHRPQRHVLYRLARAAWPEVTPEVPIGARGAG